MIEPEIAVVDKMYTYHYCQLISKMITFNSKYVKTVMEVYFFAKLLWGLLLFWIFDTFVRPNFSNIKVMFSKTYMSLSMKADI